MIETGVKRVRKAAARLELRYGLPRWDVDAHEAVATLVGTILSQNTSDKNSTPAFWKLRKTFKTMQDVLDAPEQDIADAIRGAGLENIKANRIKRALAQVKERFGKLTLEPLRKMKKADVHAFLLSLDGVGPKTAAIIMTFSLGMPSFPVDTHIFRISKRLGFVPNDASAEEAHEIMDALVPEGLKATFHVNLISLGRGVCHPRNPECGTCPLNKMCPCAFKIS